MLLERSIFLRMKNKFLTRYLCITLVAATVLAGTAPCFLLPRKERKSAGGNETAATPVATSAPEPVPTEAAEPQPTEPAEDSAAYCSGGDACTGYPQRDTGTIGNAG